MKKTISIILVAAMLVPLIVGCANGSAPSTDQTQQTPATAIETEADNQGNGQGDTQDISAIGFQFERKTIAFAVMSYTPELQQVREYFEDFIADRFNIDFIFSDNLGTDVATIINFVESAHIAGAQAIVDAATAAPSDVQSVADRVNELGMWYTTWNQSFPLVAHLEYAIGAGSQDVYLQGEQIKEILKELFGEGEPRNFILHTGMAQFGNVVQTVTSVAVLEALQEIYGLTYADDIENIVRTTNSTTRLETDRDDVRVALMVDTGDPGIDEFTNLARDGEYNVAIFSGAMYLAFESIIRDIENALDMNMYLISVAAMAPTTANSFETLDAFGNPSLDAAIVANYARFSMMIALLLNALYGYADYVRPDGTAIIYQVPNWVIMNAEEYEIAAKIGTTNDLQIFSEDDILQMFRGTNPNLNYEVLQEWASKAALDETLVRLGLR